MDCSVPAEDAPALATSLGLVLNTPAFAARLAAAGRARYEAEFAEGARPGPVARCSDHDRQSLMCGIAGIAMEPGAAPPDLAVVNALAQALAHRGPDGSGHSVLGRVALVHNRLAIIDVAGGDQPLFAGPATLIANGEVYNYRELAAGMTGLSHPQRLRAAAPFVPGGGGGVCAQAAGDVRHRDP